MLKQGNIQRESARKFTLENKFPVGTTNGPAMNSPPGPAVVSLADRVSLSESEQGLYSSEWNHPRQCLLDGAPSEEPGMSWSWERSLNDPDMQIGKIFSSHIILLAVSNEGFQYLKKISWDKKCS